MNKHFLYGCLVMVLCTCFSCSNEAQGSYIFRVSLWANEQHTWYKAFIHFRDILSERTEGRVKVEVFPSEQLAKEIESIRLIQADVIEMTVTGSLLSNWIEIAAFCEMPYLLRDSAEKSALIHGPLGRRIKEEMLEKMGLRPLGVFERSPRQLTSNRPITHPDDLEGLIVRVPSVPAFVTAWSAMGAKPTPMAFSEVFTGLQQGTIEAQENSFDLILNGGLYEVQQYVNLTAHVMSWSYPVVSERAFQELPQELKPIFLAAAVEMQEYEHQLFRENELKIQEELKERGMELIEVDKEAFSQKCEAAIYESLSDDMKRVYQDFMEYRTQKE